MMPIAIVGCDGKSFSAAGLDALHSADVIAGSQFMLDFPDIPPGKETRLLNNNYIAAIRELLPLAGKRKLRFCLPETRCFTDLELPS